MKLIRFAIGDKNVVSSSLWKAWANRKGDIYVLQRKLGKIQKFSLHASGICRWAQNRSQSGDQDRVMMRWVRGEIPPKGEGKSVCLMSLIFPSDHLSDSVESFEKILWIPPAPTGFATAIEFLLTSQSKDEVSKLLGAHGTRKLLNYQEINGESAWLTTITEFQCGEVALSVPARPNVYQE